MSSYQQQDNGINKRRDKRESLFLFSRCERVCTFIATKLKILFPKRINDRRTDR